VQDNQKDKVGVEHVTSEGSEDEEEFSDDEDSFVMMTPSTTMSQEIDTQSAATQVPFM
jgi:hypothetical protein